MALLLALLAVSGVVITEVMPNPAGPTGAHQSEDRNEFIELYNPGDEAVDLYAWTIDDGDGVDRLIPWQDSSLLASNPTLVINYTWLMPGCYAVILDSEYTDPNPAGGYVQPYRFGDSTLILTTPNTTIGNGLAVNDPLLLYPPYGGDSSSFGTPWNPDDSLPCNPGDGVSWERIDLAGPDTIDNWAVCSDSAGCTPGRQNSISSIPDLAVTGLELAHPDSLNPGQPFACLVRVSNPGHIPVSGWSLVLFLDINFNSVPDPAEESWQAAGWPFLPGTDSLLQVSLTCPQVQTDLWARIDCPADQDTFDNRLRISVNPGGSGRLLNLVATSFSPDADGFEDSLVVVYRLPETGGKLDLAVFNLAGQAVRSLHSGKPAALEGTVSWDGLSENGDLAPPGVYAVWLRYHLPHRDAVEKLPVALFR